MTDQTVWVVVIVAADGRVSSVVGPRDNKIDAQAAADVIRHENGIRTYVRPLRELNVFDVHGTDQAAWTKALQGELHPPCEECGHPKAAHSRHDGGCALVPCACTKAWK